ncbi:MAG TPA: hypothetical protein VHC91_26605 [Trinickia sp.]|uniref:hypothetical protein n=1 Tax=Trinickia sp. TaxID=2571163 RepID=UPI002C331E1B|nr:hypothetical protein [Trinickia sp.]HVW53935.1 hypothetical protein [Trinickia sp.]
MKANYAAARWLAIVCVTALGTSLTPGCSEMPPQRSTAQGVTEQRALGDVFGRVVFIVNGKEKDWGTGIFSDGIGMIVRSLDSGQVKGFRVKGDGSFVWSLKPGRYVIAAFRLPNETGRLWVSFDVPTPGHASYIGDIVIDSSKASYAFAVRDNFEASLIKNAARFDAAKLTPSKDIMRPEDRLGTYEAMWGICSARSGLKCSSSLHGVEPLTQGSAIGHPPVASLTPLLEWKPSSRADISYDVAVYESISLTAAGFGAARTQGPVVAYAQGLREPRYQIEKPLDPGKKYDWSVRIRDGNTVSNWSTGSYGVFFVVGYISGWGQWFGFSTPAAR